MNKQCPFCSEEILKTAKLCKHCGRDLDKKKSGGGCAALVILAVVAIGLYAGLSAPSRRGETRAAVPPPPSAPTPTRVPAPKVEHQRHGWSSGTTQSDIDDSTTAILALYADDEISGWPGKSETPRLVLRCQGNQTSAYVITGFHPDVEAGNIDGATVTIRFDSERARTLNASKSTDNETLFLPGAVGLIRSMIRSERMLLRFVPFNSDPATAVFHVAGLAEEITPLRSACNW